MARARSTTPIAARKLDGEVRDYLKRVADVNGGAEEMASLCRLKCGTAVVGLLKEGVVQELTAFPHVFQRDLESNCVTVHSSLKTCEERTNAIAEVMARMCEKGAISGWRNELYPVVCKFGDDPFFLVHNFPKVERAAAPMLGIKAYGVHVNGYVMKGDEMFLWVGKRSPTKQTWPSRLDHIAAGGQSFGIGLTENVIKECEEEAGIPEPLAKKAKPVGVISYAYLEENGVKQDVLFVYDLLLPEGFIPQPNDGEMESFTLMPVSKVQQIVRTTTDYKPNCAVVVIDFFVRHGLVSPDQNGYLDLLTALRSGTCS